MAYLTQYSNSVPVIKFPIDQSLMTIGQHIDMDICVPEDGVADKHAQLKAVNQAQGYRFIIKSLENNQLIQLNGETVSHAELQDGDWVMIGDVEFQFTDDGVNEIKADVVIPINVPKQTPLESQIQPKIETTLKKDEATALELIQELKKEVEAMSADTQVEEKHFSRRLNLF